MPKYQITGPDGQKFEVNAPDGASEEEVLAYAQRSFKMAATPKNAPSKPFGEQLNDAVGSVPRQLGLTARYGLEGVGGTFDAMVGNPLRTLAAPVFGNKPRADTGGTLADMIGLPQPETASERVVGDASRMVAGSALPIGAGMQLAKNGAGVAQKVGQVLSANPAQQIASAGAAGGAGAYTRETGGNDRSQIIASLAAGIATPFTMNAAQRTGQTGLDVLNRLRTPAAPPQVQVDITINSALQPSGIALSDLPAEVASGIRADVAKALQTGQDLSPDAVRRLADYRLVGATPNRAGLTLNAADVTQQRNLAKLGINSKDPAAQQLGLTQQTNNQTLTQGLNRLGAATADDSLAGGSKVMSALEQRNARAKDLIGERYDAARATDGRSAALDPSVFTTKANDMLDQALLGGKLPGDVRNLLNKAATGEMPLTVDVAEQLKTRIGELQRSTMDMAERKALGMVRGALDDTPLLPGQEIGKQALDAFGKARSLNKAWMGIVEKTPALQAVRDGIEPDKFVQQFIVGSGTKSNVMDVAMLKNSIKSSPEAMDAVKTQITSFLKQKALNGAADETGNFSQSAYNKALEAVGERKLKLFFSSEDINQLKAIGRVASYEQFQPMGSAVNNSNTAATGMSAMLDRIGSSAMLSKVPLGKLVSDPLQNIAIGMQSKRALSAPDALTIGMRQGPRLPLRPPGLMMSPAMLMGLTAEEQRQ